MSEQQAPEAPSTAEVSMQQVDELLAADQQAEEAGEEPVETEEPAETQPEPQPEPQEEARGGDLRVALREERERRRQAEQEAAQVKANQRVLAAAMQQFQQQYGQKQPQVPDFESDPAGHLRFQVETMRNAVTQLHQQQQQREMAERQQAMLSQAENAVVNVEEGFAKENPDYYDAVSFMRERLARRFETLGVPKEQVPAAVAHDLRTFGLKAIQGGANPAEKLFQLAKIEGYNGGQKADSQRLSTIARGVQATRGGRSTAPASSGEMTMEAANKLSYKELAKMSDDQWAKLMGGA